MLPMLQPDESEPLLPAHIRAAGGVRLRFARAGGRTQRLELAESGGYRARFPAQYDGRCEAVLINSGGGMAGGDALRIEAALDAGADATITTQAAEKIYRSQGDDAKIVTSLSLDEGARLFWLPQESILFSGARLSRSLDLDYVSGAHFLACETVVFGRLAMGEAVQRGALRDRWRIRCEGRLVFAEDVRLEGPVAELLARPAIGLDARAVATLVAHLPEAATRLDEVRELLREQADSVEAGAGLLGDLLVCRLLSRDPAALRRNLVTLAAHLTGRALPRCWSI